MCLECIYHAIMLIIIIVIYILYIIYIKYERCAMCESTSESKALTVVVWVSYIKLQVFRPSTIYLSVVWRLVD